MVAALFEIVEGKRSVMRAAEEPEAVRCKSAPLGKSASMVAYLPVAAVAKKAPRILAMRTGAPVVAEAVEARSSCRLPAFHSAQAR